MGSITRLNAREAGWHCELSAGWLPWAPRCWYLHHNLQIRTVALLPTNNETPSSSLLLERERKTVANLPITFLMPINS